MADETSPSQWPEHDVDTPPVSSVVVDCDGCVVRGLACDDCVVTVLLGPTPERRQWDRDELSALDALAGAGLVPPLRLVEAVDPPDDGESDVPDEIW
ncbi:MAG: hypothetical protein K0Q93_3228 [Nocardioidaceae bacterium]|nr:hypothetical protein [Nocardioidaceae bacterium]